MSYTARSLLCDNVNSGCGSKVCRQRREEKVMVSQYHLRISLIAVVLTVLPQVPRGTI